MEDKEHVERIVKLVYDLCEAATAARKDGLTVNLSANQSSGFSLGFWLAVTVQIERTTPLFDVGKKVDISRGGD
jgi:hypothetical protein